MTTLPTTTDRQTLSAPRPAAPCPTQSGLPACSKAVPPGKGGRLHLLPALVLVLLVSSGRPALAAEDQAIAPVAKTPAAAPSSSEPVLIGPMHLLLRNKPPIPTFSSFTMDENTIKNGTLTATDPEGKPLSYAKAGEPGHGTLSVNADGGFTYTPTANYFGLDSFIYSVSDGVNTVNQVVAVTVTDVAEANQAPVALDTTQDWGGLNGAGTVDLAALISDDHTSDANMIVNIVSNPDGFTYDLSDLSNVQLIAPPGSALSSTLEYEACDEANACDIGTITINNWSN